MLKVLNRERRRSIKSQIAYVKSRRYEQSISTEERGQETLSRAYDEAIVHLRGLQGPARALLVEERPEEGHREKEHKHPQHLAHVGNELGLYVYILYPK